MNSDDDKVTRVTVPLPPRVYKWDTAADPDGQGLYDIIAPQEGDIILRRDPAGARNAKRVAKDRARRKAAKRHKQHMRRCGK